LREKEKVEAEAAVIELNNFKQKYREENRKMKESTQERDETLQALGVAKDQIERLTRQLEERTQQSGKEKATLELEKLQERNNLTEQIENLKLELRTERLSIAKRIQETEETVAAQAKVQQDELKTYVARELERRVTVAVERALAEAAIKAEEVKQQAVTDARIAFNAEKERSAKLLQDDFNARLQQEIKSAFEKGKQTGFKEGTVASEKTAQVLAQTQAQVKEVNAKASASAQKQVGELEKELDTQKKEFDREIAAQKRLIATLKNQASTGRTDTRADMEAIVKGIVNDTFKALRELIEPDLQYSGATVLDSVRNVLVTKTLGGLPKAEPEAPFPEPEVLQDPEPENPEPQYPKPEDSEPQYPELEPIVPVLEEVDFGSSEFSLGIQIVQDPSLEASSVPDQ